MDSLSFSAHVHRGLDQYLQEALFALRCPIDKLKNFDHHSPIVIGLNTLPDIRVAVINDRLWIWSVLSGVHESQIDRVAARLLSLLLQPVEGVACGQLSLGLGTAGYELKALIDVKQLPQSSLRGVLEQFHQKLTDVCQLLDLKKWH